MKKKIALLSSVAVAMVLTAGSPAVMAESSGQHLCVNTPKRMIKIGSGNCCR